MLTIKTTPEFSVWLAGIKDGMAKRRLARQLEKAKSGNLGDVRPVGEGVLEMREHFGPGWRMYYVQRGAVLIVMLGGGDNPPSLPTLPGPSDWRPPSRIKP